MSKTAEQVVRDTLNIEMVDYSCLACGHGQKETIRSKSERVVSSLRREGWLREDADYLRGQAQRETIARLERELGNAKAGNDINLRNFLDECAKTNELRGRIATLERDLAASREPKACDGCRSLSAELASRRRRIEWLERANDALESREATPAMLRVVEALDKLKAAGLRDMKRRHWWVDPLHPLCNAEWNELVAAHIALKALAAPAVEKPRYEAVASSGGWQEGGCVRDIRTQELVFGCWRQGDAYYHGKRCEEECARLNAEAAR